MTLDHFVVDRCRPYFLCMLGERYGWSQPEQGDDQLLSFTYSQAIEHYPWIQEYRDRSITELEIRHAGMHHSVCVSDISALVC